jgi:2'-5' RNA ligase
MRALPDRLRAFVALRMNAETEAAIASFVSELRELGRGVSWVRSANLHLTLRFLGSAVPSAMLPPLDRALSNIASTTPAFELRAHGTGAFPKLVWAKVIWIGLSSDQLMELAGQVEAAARGCGFAPESRPYAPHLTIGRVRRPRGWAAIRERLAECTDYDFGRSVIDSMILYRSVLGRGGPTYEVIARYPFQSS